MRHGLRERFHHSPEFPEALAQMRHDFLMTVRAFERSESNLILLSEVIELLREHAALRGRAADEELAHVVAGQPDVLAQGSESFVLFDEMTIDIQMLAGDVELNA